MRGEMVTVEIKTETGRDRYNSPEYSTEQQEVDNVLVAPGDVDQASQPLKRPEGIEVQYTLFFPKSYDGPMLERQRILVRGKWLKVIGYPDRYDDINCPTEWNMTVKVSDYDG